MGIRIQQKMPHGRKGRVWRLDNGYIGYCSTCEREFSNMRALTLHTRMKHPEIKHAKNVPTIDLCSKCKKELQAQRQCKYCPK